MFGEAPHLALRDAVDLGDVGDGGASMKGVERSDHGHVLGAVALENILDHLVAPVPGQVQIDVGELGELHALPVEEALEREAEAEGTHVADGQRVAHQAPCRAPPRQRFNAVTVRPFDNIGEDQEILGIADLFDHV